MTALVLSSDFHARRARMGIIVQSRPVVSPAGLAAIRPRTAARIKPRPTVRIKPLRDRYHSVVQGMPAAITADKELQRAVTRELWLAGTTWSVLTRRRPRSSSRGARAIRMIVRAIRVAKPNATLVQIGRIVCRHHSSVMLALDDEYRARKNRDAKERDRARRAKHCEG